MRWQFGWARRRTLLRFVAVCVAACACTGAPRSEDAAAPDVATSGREFQVLLVVPLNLAVPMPKDLEGPSPAVWEALEKHLLAHGKQLKTVSYQDARRLWQMSVERARESGNGDSTDLTVATSLLAVELRRHTEFDAVIAPSVLVRQAAVQGTRATWDGVTRPIEIHRENRSIRSSKPRAAGTARAASLHVAVFDASGRQIHAGQGGLDLLVRVRLDEGFSEYLATSTHRYFEPRPDFFDDPALLREGVAKALDPFVSPGNDE